MTQQKPASVPVSDGAEPAPDAPEGARLPICGDATCQSWACTHAALNAWHAQQEANARAIVRGSLGLPVAPEVDWAERYRTDCPDDCISAARWSHRRLPDPLRVFLMPDRLTSSAESKAARRSLHYYRRKRFGWACVGPAGCGATVRDLPGHSHYEHPATHQRKYCSMPHPVAVKPALRGRRHGW